jgi:hypothetical protein
MVRLAETVRHVARVDVVSRTRHLRPDDETLYQYPVVFMTGHYRFAYSDDQLALLRDYLDKGGVLLANACCGKEAFDKSFRKMVARLYPQEELNELPSDHPLLTGTLGEQLGELTFRPALAKKLNRSGTRRPPIEILELDGRAAILYSRYDWCCSLEGDKPFACLGYDDESGRRLAAVLLLFAIGY